ncbi:hypothetical protein GCK72_007012 [Caenorhabditis remanei]|uniref:Uncharacterized protein n=1 Tax=Caenorhabditis remanei TaxID=31234 RepID=A0A6A5HKC9_CAERE|nr:hypothetical protein GCK72_007012 [Caenorhabditis remanei]KAF1767054.1 hypothetical protein GCK72_007012 [Caenorhabditis remanei]
MYNFFKEYRERQEKRKQQEDERNVVGNGLSPPVGANLPSQNKDMVQSPEKPMDSKEFMEKRRKRRSEFEMGEGSSSGPLGQFGQSGPIYGMEAKIMYNNVESSSASTSQTPVRKIMGWLMKGDEMISGYEGNREERREVELVHQDTPSSQNTNVQQDSPSNSEFRVRELEDEVKRLQEKNEALIAENALMVHYKESYELLTASTSPILDIPGPSSSSAASVSVSSPVSGPRSFEEAVGIYSNWELNTTNEDKRLLLLIKDAPLYLFNRFGPRTLPQVVYKATYAYDIFMRCKENHNIQAEWKDLSEKDMKEWMKACQFLRKTQRAMAKSGIIRLMTSAEMKKEFGKELWNVTPKKVVLTSCVKKE